MIGAISVGRANRSSPPSALMHGDPMTHHEDMQHGNWKRLSIGYEEAFTRVPEALKAQGFGVITQIDMRETLKSKIGVDFRRYHIFGACNPSFAHAALKQDARVGVLLPCNVVLYEADDGKAVVGAIDPMQTLGAEAGTELAKVAAEVGKRLELVLASLPE